MMPNDDNNRRDGTPLEPQRHFLVSPTRTTPSARPAAVGLIRSQIDAIYSGHTTTPTPQTTPLVVPPRTNLALAQPRTQEQTPTQAPTSTTIQPTAQSSSTASFQITNPYDRTHTVAPQPQPEQWQKYHSAWQDYYKQYYERYYANQVQQAHFALSSQVAITTAARQAIGSGNSDNDTSNDDTVTSTKAEALRELRGKLRNRVRSSATKVRKSKHFVPLVAAIVVVIAFSFLQYNRLLFATVAAYVTPGSIDPQNIIIDPTSEQNVGPESKLIIPKINVDVPIIYGVSNDYQAQMDAMTKGVMHFSIPGASSVPGQVGNMVIAGHSSNDILDTGDYKFIFAQNEKLEPGDTIYINYNSVRYTYTVTKKQVVLPTDVSALTTPTDKPILTLITCVPLGTALKRLLVTAEQVSPDPAKAAPAPATNSSDATTALPGNSPTFVQRIFGAK